jgi:hypothetical protein
VWDNGPAVDNFAAIEKMFGFGFSGKQKQKGQIGQYGLGVKHAGMRLAHYVLAFIKSRHVAYLVLMSPKYLEENLIDDVTYPCACFRRGPGEGSGGCAWEKGSPLSLFVAHRYE